MGIQINKKFLPLKAHYFFFNAGTAPVVPFMPTLIKQLGFSSVVLGLVYYCLPIVSILTKPIFGILADKLKKQKLLFIVFQLITVIGLFNVIFVPPIARQANVSLDCFQDSSSFNYCPASNNSGLDPCVVDRLINLNTTENSECKSTCKIPADLWHEVCHEWNIDDDCTVIKDDITFKAFIPKNGISEVNQCLFFGIGHVQFGLKNSTLSCNKKLLDISCLISCSDPEITDVISNEITVKEASKLYQFWLLFFFLILSWAGMAVVVSVGDAICFEMLEDKPQLYGYQRLWGSVGWGTFSFLAGYFVDLFSKGKYEKDYTVIFYMALVLIGMDIIFSSKLKHNQTKHSANFMRDLRSLVASPKVVTFFFWCIAVGMCTALIWNLLFWHLEELASKDGCNNNNWIKTLEGIVMGIQCFGGELPFFWLSGYILKKLGHINAMTLVLAAFGIRFLCYFFLVNPWYVLPIEFLNGLTFGLFFATMASYASVVAPPGTEATMQGIVGGIFEGIGVSCGSLIGGIFMSKYGGSLTFLYFAISAMVLAGIHFILQLFLQSGNSRSKIYDLKEEIMDEQDKVHEHLTHQETSEK